MKLIVGLGNSGEEYAQTRHNAGWLALDYLLERWQMPAWRRQKRLDSLISRDHEQNRILAKPETMMNNSGWAVRKLLDYYELGVGDLLLVHDDADLELGDVRISVASRTGAGHHGVVSVIDHIGPGFRRVRIGIGRPQQPVRDISNYVLDKLSTKEHQQLDQAFAKAIEIIEQ
jgi:PTH1 family peptidyl-tRNA hydrolase